MTTEPDPTQVPKAAPPGYRYASAWIRLLALIIDGLLMFVVVYVLFLVLSGLLLMSYPQVAESLLGDIDSKTWQAGLLTYVIIGVLTLAWFGGWQAGAGATPAMLLLKLRVRDRSGQDNPSFGAAVLRNSPMALVSFGDLTGNEGVDVMLGVVSFAVYAAIGLSITSNAQYQGFHDRLAGTFVVRPG